MLRDGWGCREGRCDQASIERSLSGLEQQARIFPAATSRGRMPPLWFISTSPESLGITQVPHMPWPHDDGRRTLAASAASSTFSSARHETERPLLVNSTEYVATPSSPTGGAA